jgi:fluoroquinolone transport system permease protein
MKRLLASIRHDIVLQFRNGFYYASAFVAGLMVIGLRALNLDIDWGWLWPPLVLSNLTINAFYFMAGQVLLEKGEGTLEAQIVSPLRQWEYLAAKVISLSLLSILESLAIVALVSGIGLNALLFAIGVILLVIPLALYGFWVVARYDSISEFLLPSVLWTVWVSLPLVYYFDLWRHPIFFLHPTQPTLVIMQSAFHALPAWQVIYGLGYGALVILGAFWLARRAFYRFVVTQQGVKA